MQLWFKNFSYLWKQFMLTTVFLENTKMSVPYTDNPVSEKTNDCEWFVDYLYVYSLPVCLFTSWVYIFYATLLFAYVWWMSVFLEPVRHHSRRSVAQALCLLFFFLYLLFTWLSMARKLWFDVNVYLLLLVCHLQFPVAVIVRKGETAGGLLWAAAIYW